MAAKLCLAGSDQPFGILLEDFREIGVGVARASWSAARLPFHYPQIRQPDLEPSDVAELADDRKGASPNLRESAKSADSSSSSSRERIRKGSRGGAELVEGRWRGAIARTRSIPRESEKEESADFADGRRFFVSSPWQPHSRSRLNMRLEKMWVMERRLRRFRSRTDPRVLRRLRRELWDKDSVRAIRDESGGNKELPVFVSQADAGCLCSLFLCKLRSKKLFKAAD